MSEEKLREIENRLDRIEEWNLKIIRRHPLKLKERFAVHDRAVMLVGQFEAMTGGIPGDTLCFVAKKVGNELTMEKHPEIKIKDLKEIIINLRRLVDHSLGVQYPAK